MSENSNSSIVSVKNMSHFPETLFEFIEKVNTDQHFVIRDGKWQRIGLPVWSKEILQWKLNNTLKLWDNHCPGMLTQIKDIRFPNLRVLNLQNNQIVSVECLNRVYLPSLESLDLAKNHITCIKSIRKVHQPRLKQLSLSDNKITNFEKLLEMQSSGLTILHIQWYRDEVFCHNPRWLAKIDSQKLNKLLIQSSSTIGEEEEIFKKLVKKVVNLKISKKRR